MENKKYYWLKLKENFFDEKHIKFLRKLPEGDKLVIVYLKMQLKSLRTEGIIKYDKILPNNIEEIAMVLDEETSIVSLAVQSLIKSNAIEMLDDGSLYMLAMQELIGKEGASAERVRKFRESQQIKLLQCNTDVTKCNTEIEIEKEIETDIDIEIEKEKNKKAKHKYGEYQRIILTNNEYEKLCDEFGKDFIDNQIVQLDEYVESNNNKNQYKNFNLVLRKSIREGWFKPRNQNFNNKQSGNIFFDILEEEGKICREIQ